MSFRHSALMKVTLFALTSLTLSDPILAEPIQGFSVMAGLGQPLMFQGGNVAVTYTKGQWIYEYSHGFGLKLHKFEPALTSQEQDEKMELNMPWTTGGGVGYYFTDSIALALEVKAHRYDARHASGAEKSYTTYSVGPGLYYTKHFGKHLFIQPVLRFWPNVGSSEKDGKVNFRRLDGTEYVHKVHDFGLFANISAGWTF